ncbi:LOW QUALITY PROTEIN: hypothetical protein HID58_046816, partial [Brassica napus]
MSLWQIVLVLFFTLSSSTYHSNGKLILEGFASFDSSGFTKLTNTTKHSYGHVFNSNPVLFKNSSLNFHFHLGIVPEHNHSGSHGMACVLSPTRHLPGVSSDQYLVLFNKTTNDETSNNIIAIELDIHKDEEFGDIVDNHVGININGLRSVVSALAGYYDDNDGKFHNIDDNHVGTSQELYNATKGFKEKQVLGSGGFGQVYKGTLPRKSEFIAEISTIGRLRHPNLVRLLGYCRHRDDLFLVYDFMPNGSLDKYKYRNENKERLLGINFIKDIASDLLHMQQEWIQVIIQRDIKPANVLIDQEMNARLGDFGLAKMYDQGIDPQTSKVSGTLEEQLPALIERREANNEEVLVEWILELWEEGNFFDAAEECIRQEPNMGEIELVLKLGVLCSYQAESVSSDMSAVMRILNGVSQLPNNLLDVVRAERLRGQHVISMEMLFDMNSMSMLPFTNSFISHAWTMKPEKNL